MPTYVALLRGVNVGGRRPVPMPQLRAALPTLGFENVRTYIQSGNVVFEATPGEHGPAIRALIAERFGHADVPVMTRPGEDIARVAESHPYAARGEDERSLHVTFLERAPTPAELARLTELDARAEELTLDGRELYLFCPNGYGRARLKNEVCEQRLKMRATTRNLRTVRALAAMIEAG